MDWFSWLSKTDIEPSLVNYYALTFVHNELQEDDIAYFSHDLLQSMGITVAKHRLEILKLARKEKCRMIHPMLRFTFAMKHTKSFLAKRIQALVRHENLAIVPKTNYSLRWKVAMLQRIKKLRITIPEREKIRSNGDFVDETGHKMLMLTNGSPAGSQSSVSDQNSSRADKNSHITEDMLNHEKLESDDGEDWSSSEEIRWDTMFQNLKPT